MTQSFEHYLFKELVFGRTEQLNWIEVLSWHREGQSLAWDLIGYQRMLPKNFLFFNRRNTAFLTRLEWSNSETNFLAAQKLRKLFSSPKFSSMAFSLTAVTVKKECAPSDQEFRKSACNKLYTTELSFSVVMRAQKCCNKWRNIVAMRVTKNH